MLLRWVEVRPIVHGEYPPGCFSSILEVLYNSRKPFRFIAAPIQSASGKRIIRFYFQVEEDFAERFSSLLRSRLGVQTILDSKPSEGLYELRVEYDLRAHFALPVIDFDRKMEVNSLDGIVTALADAGGAFEVAAEADVGAKKDIYEWIRGKTGGASFGDALLNHIFNALGAVLGGGYMQRSGGSQASNPIIKVRVAAAEKKVNRSLFRCAIRAYGGPGLAKAVLEVLPSTPLNRFFISNAEVWRRLLPEDIERPRRHRVRNLVSSLLPPLSIIAIICCFLTGLITLNLTDFDLMLIALLLAPAPLTKILLPKKPLILSTEELGFIIGLPTGVGRLPVETALAPPTRGRFISGE